MTAGKWLLIAVLFGGVALGLWVFMLRAASAVVATVDGVIVSKTFAAGRTRTQVPVGINRGMQTPTEVAIAERYIFEIRIDHRDERLFYGLNSVAGRSFDVGQRVRISYRAREVPFGARKYVVLDMESIGTPPSGPERSDSPVAR